LAAAAVLLLAAGNLIASVPRATVSPAVKPVEASTNAPPELVLPLAWHPTIDAALLEADANDRPILLFFRSSSCGWCERLRMELESQELRTLLQGFARAEIDVDRDRALAAKLHVDSIPVLLLAGPDGRELQRLNGYMPASQLRVALTKALTPGAASKTAPDITRRLEQMDAGHLAEDDWPGLLAAMGETSARDRVRGYVSAHSAEMRARLVPLLRHTELAVRLGALELLEELGGDTLGFDPWGVPVADANAGPLRRWEAWLAQPGGSNALYTALPATRVSAYLNDLIGSDHDHVLRATRALTQAGGSCREALEQFLAEHRDLVEGPRKRVEEVRLAVQMPPVAGLDGPTLAHHLMFGTPDTRMRALDQLGRAGRLAAPIILPFTADPDAMIRAAAVEALVKAGGPEVTRQLVARAQVEPDADVLQTIFLALGKKPGIEGGKLLVSAVTNANENLAITALAGLSTVPDAAEANAVLQKALCDPRWRVRVAALDAAAKIRPENLAARIEALTRDPDAFVRLSAIKALVATRKKNALETLETLFLENDELKPTIAGVYVELETAFPEKFGPALQGKPAELLLGVLTPIKDKGKARHVPLALSFVAHPDSDVACTALRTVAAIGVSLPRGRAALMEALQSGAADRQLAVLENLKLPKAVQIAARAASSGDLPADASGEKTAATEATNAPAAAARSAAPEVDALFDAFSGQPAPAATAAAPVNVVATTAAPARVVAPQDATADELFRAFSAAAPTVTAAPAVATVGAAENQGTATNSMAALCEQVRTLMTHSPDVRVRCEAAMVLAAAGETGGVLYLAENFDPLDARQREQLASALPNAGATNSLPLLRRLLRDPTPDVRNAAAGAALDSKITAFIDAVLTELSAPDALLQPQEQSFYRLQELARDTHARTMYRWALRFIAPSQRDAIRVLGFLLLEDGRDASNAEVVEGYLQDTSAFVRRAAYRALSLIAPDVFLRHAETAAKDSSPLVRETVTAFAARGTYEDVWMVRFSENVAERKSDYSFESHSDDSSPAMEKLLRGLLADSDATVRTGAAVALLEARRPVDLAKVAETLSMLPSGHRARELVLRYMVRNAKTLGPAFRVLVPYLDADQENSVNEIEKAMASRATGAATGTNLLFLARAEPVVTKAIAAARPAPAPIRLVFFQQTGCSDCRRAERWLAELQRALPQLVVESHNIGLIHAKELNETLGRRFHVPESDRLVAPAVFGGAGALTRNEITFDRLAALAVDSANVPLESWYPANEHETQKAKAELIQRGRKTGLAVVVAGGLLDGINPCAFATLIFFISYLQIMRRKPVELLQVGAAFITGVFLSYLAIGLGLREIVGRLTAIHGLVLGVNGAIAILTAVLAFLNFRDGVRCRQGRMAEMTLQLPTALKRRIHATVREGAKMRLYIVAAFVVAVLVSMLELVCTGQGYLPVITYLWQVGYDRATTIGLLVIYNVAFVVPLAVVFVLTYRGLRSEALVRALNRHAAGVKFATAALFVFLFAMIAWQVWRM